MIEQLNKLLEEFENELKGIKDENSFETIKKKFTGKESPMNSIMAQMRTATPEVKKEAGALANKVKNQIADELNKLQDSFEQEKIKKQLASEKINVSLPGVNLSFGNKHPLNLVIEEISTIFNELGFDMVDGTEFETDEYCFQRLNLPKGHPARDMQDTFYISENTVLRTHSTNMTARMLTELSSAKEEDQNVAAISYGNVYRRDDDDATHSHQFMQIDGFAMSEKISFANLKWILQYMCKRLFNKDTEIRMRPSFFPFTEPSVEVDITCITCGGKGCNICKHTGYIEILGAGMVNPKVMELNGIDPIKKTCLAFGIGVERIAMLKFGIKNIRDFYENDTRFLEQFKYFG